MKPCTCAPSAVTKYQKRISGPLLDRIDIHVEVPRVDYQKLSDDRLGESSETIRQRVQAARDIQRNRFVHPDSRPSKAQSSWVAWFKAALAGLEGRPGALQAVPRTVDRLVELFIPGQVVIGGRQAAQVFIAGEHALQKIYRQERSFGVDGSEGATRAGLHG